MRSTILAGLMLTASACAATQPQPDPFNQFVVGQSRVQVVEQLGMPHGSIKDGANSCDIYPVYSPVSGYPLRFLAAVLTSGLSTLYTVETRTQHNVLLCYGPDSRLIVVRESTSVPLNYYGGP